MKHCQLLCREWMSTTHHTHTIHNQTTSLIVLLACRFVVVVAIAFADDNDNDGLLFIEIVWFLYGCRTATRHTHTHTSRFHKYNSIFAYILFICWFFFSSTSIHLYHISYIFICRDWMARWDTVLPVGTREAPDIGLRWVPSLYMAGLQPRRILFILLKHCFQLRLTC